MAKEKPETKLCKHCKTEIPYGAKICPNCKKKQGMSGCLVVIIVIVALGIIGFIIGGNEEQESTPANSTSKPQQTETVDNNEDDNTAEDNTSDGQNEEPIPQEPEDTETMGQKNARAKAKSYLAYTSFSYSGLIEQLEFEGFSTEEATYATDKCGADWNEQAALKAQSYLEYTSFSRSGLIEQLEFEGFTAEQAEYGAQAVGY